MESCLVAPTMNKRQGMGKQGAVYLRDFSSLLEGILKVASNKRGRRGHTRNTQGASGLNASALSSAYLRHTRKGTTLQFLLQHIL